MKLQKGDLVEHVYPGRGFGIVLRVGKYITVYWQCNATYGHDVTLLKKVNKCD